MFEVICLDEKTKRIFIRKFEDRKLFSKFIENCRNSRLIKIIDYQEIEKENEKGIVR